LHRSQPRSNEITATARKFFASFRRWLAPAEGGHATTEKDSELAPSY
jgi:hypothetical protein